MSREIKFRAWDISGRKMISNFQFIASFNSDGSINTYYGAEIMQYTGLKDMNGKEIYEGDIYEGNDGRIYRVFFRYGAFCSGLIEDSSEPLGWEILDNRMAIDNLNWFEVIGNIYETPELIH